MTRSEYQTISGAVQLPQRFLAHCTQEAHPVSHTEPCCQCAQRRLVRSGARNVQRRIRQHRQRRDDQVVSLPRNEMADRSHCKTAHAELGARGQTIDGSEQFEIDAVAKHVNLAISSAELDHFVLERGADGDRRHGSIRRPKDHFPRDGVLGNLVDIAAARRYHDRLA